MIDKHEWTMTTLGPRQVEDLIDIPHIAVTRASDEEYVLRGYTPVPMGTKAVTITAQGHRLTVGANMPVYIRAEVAYPASSIKPHQEIQVFTPEQRSWVGEGGTEEQGALFGEIAQHGISRIARDLLDRKGIDLLDPENGWIIKCWSDPSHLERMSSAFYAGFLREFIVCNVMKRDVYKVDRECQFKAVPADTTLRMMLRLGAFAFTEDALVIPSYALRSLILATNALSSEEGMALWNDVQGMHAPTFSTIVVDSVEDAPVAELYATRELMAGSVMDINGFQVAATI